MGSKAALEIKLDRLSARGLAQAVQSLLEDRSDPIPQIGQIHDGRGHRRIDEQFRDGLSWHRQSSSSRTCRLYCLVAFQMASSPFPEPGREILRVIRARLVGDAKIGAEESGSEFGDLS